MNAQGLFSIGGIASGLDTNDIVEQLLRLERQPITRLEARKATLESTKEAWGQITTRLSALRTATDQLRRPDRFSNLISVSSSNPEAVSVSRGSGSVDAAQLSFSVEQLATRMVQTSGDRFTDVDAAIDNRTLSISVQDAEGNWQETNFTTGLGEGASYRDLIAAVNDAGLGVSASALQVAPGEFQLVLEADQTGEANAFQVTATNWGEHGGEHGFELSQEALNARLNRGGITIERSSNTITDLVPGATITLNATTSGPVTVSAQRDIEGAIAAVKGFVDAVNNTIKNINELTAYNAETGASGPLQGQFAATQLAFDLRAAVTAPVAGLTGANATASAIGIRTGRDGLLSLDEAQLRQAFTDDFEGTARRFSRAGEVGDPDAATSVTGSRTTQAGSYDVQVTSAAQIARATGASYTPPNGQPKAFTVIAPNGKAVTVRIDTDQQSASQAAAKIQQALDEAGVTGLRAGTDGDQLTLESTAYGSNVSFSVQEVEVEDGEIVLDVDGNPIAVAVADGVGAFGLQGTHTGQDVQGTIGGEAATGRGRTLSISTGPAAGLEVNTVGGIEPVTFEVSFWQGIGGAVDNQLSRAEGVAGTINRARNALDSQMRIFDSRIEAFEQRLLSREATLRRQFVGLETAISQFNAQSQWLDGQIAQLNAINAQGASRR